MLPKKVKTKSKTGESWITNFSIDPVDKIKCNRCGEIHPIFYQKQKNDKIVLAIACYNSKPRVTFLPFEPNLDIPTFPSIKIIKKTS
ncbi:MAG: hypothetical protein WC623_24140 [Pedobacter sp.]|uniref:hypothetical protein n=1 Tax=Pedobacter sp. TaxID=1411316 RepID=UPI003562725A